jgi:hypothetical protein
LSNPYNSKLKIQIVGQKVYIWAYNTLRNFVNIFGGYLTMGKAHG